MADTQAILNAASNLGTLLANHPTVSSYKETMRQLELDVGAKNLLQQYEQLVEMLTMKEAQMQPIEVAEKKQFEQLQQAMMMSPTIKKFITTQGEYAELMRKVQESINTGIAGRGAPAPEVSAPAAPSKIILDT